VVAHLSSRGMSDGERCVTSENGGGKWHINITEQRVGLLAYWFSKVGETFSPIGLPTFGG